MGLPVYLNCAICSSYDEGDLRVCSIRNEPHCDKCHKKHKDKTKWPKKNIMIIMVQFGIVLSKKNVKEYVTY